MNLLMEELLIAVGVFLLALIMHEIGHFVSAKDLGHSSKIGIDKRGLYTLLPDNMPASDHLTILTNGIFWGAVVALSSLLVCFSFSPAVLICYFFGCRHDLKQVRRLKLLSKGKRK